MTSVTTDIQDFGPGDVGHNYTPGSGFGTLRIGAAGMGRTALFFNDTATIDAVIAHLAELKTDMIAAAVEAKRLLDPPAQIVPEPGECACGHLKGSHMTGSPMPCAMTGCDCGKFRPVTPVIADDERDCDQANPDSGAHCRRGGDHGVHRDINGGEWRAGGPSVVRVIAAAQSRPAARIIGPHPDASADRRGYAPDESGAAS